jgi:SNF2 family DNA or RNA helicase
MTYKLQAPLHGYQKRAAKHVLQNKGNGLFLEMGLGKTLTALEVINFRLVKGHVKRALVIAPRRICEQVWRQEATHWKYPYSVKFLSGGPRQRLAELKKPTADVYLLTYENLPWLAKQNLFPFDLVVLDELSKMKNSGSIRWRAFKKLRSRHNFKVVGLTGTPSPNGYHDLWAMMYCLDQGSSLGAQKGTFLNTYFTDTSRDPTRYHRWKLKPGAKEQIDALLRRAGVLAMLASDVLDQKKPVVLPHIYIDLPARCQRMYAELERELMVRLPDGTVVLVEHSAVTKMKLRQLSSGFMKDESGKVHRLHSGKQAALAEYVEELAGEPVLLVYTFVEELEMMREVLGRNLPYLGGGVSEAQADGYVRAWNARELPAMAIQPQSGGHGLNLQFGGHHILFFGLDWDLDTYQQVIARLNRQGQTSPVFIRHLVAGEVETQVLASLADKARLQASLMSKLAT